MHETRPGRHGRSLRGPLIVAALVLIGIAFGSQWWKAPELRETKRRIRAAIESAPTSAEGRLDVWVEYANPQIHSCLSQMRLAPEHPWLVTHAVRIAGADDVEFHGIDLAGLPLAPARRDGMVVRLLLPAPRAVGRGPLSGEHARYVQVFAPGTRVPDPLARARSLVLRALGELPAGLARDIPGASLAVEVGPEAGWGEPEPAGAPPAARPRDPAETDP